MVGSYFLFCVWLAVIFSEDWSYSKSFVKQIFVEHQLCARHGVKVVKKPVGCPQEAQFPRGQREVGSCPQQATWGRLSQLREERWDASSHQTAALLTLVLRLGGTQINRICFPGALSLRPWCVRQVLQPKCVHVWGRWASAHVSCLSSLTFHFHVAYFLFNLSFPE